MILAIFWETGESLRSQERLVPPESLEWLADEVSVAQSPGYSGLTSSTIRGADLDQARLGYQKAAEIHP